MAEKVLRRVFLIGFFLILTLPLLHLPPWFTQSDWGKTIVFRIVLSILIFLFLWQILTAPDRTSFNLSKVKIPLIFLSLLFFIYLLATIFSLDRNFSLWGSPYRAGGFLNFTFYLIFVILTFLILKKEEWPKIWAFAISIAILVSIIAIFQQFGLMSKFLIPYPNRPPATLGNPISLAIYLLLFVFLTLSFGLKTEAEKRIIKKIFYFVAFFLFLFVIFFISQTRAAIFGFLFGFFYFLFFFPFKRKFLSLTLKILFLILFLAGVYAFYYINTQPLPQFIKENKILASLISRFKIENLFANARISAWKVSWLALKERPILGYGPENFSIGFDRFYDPSLAGIEKSPDEFPSGWWDRAHNFIFDISLSAGIFALIIYLSLLAILFWQLGKLKKTEEKIVAQGLQATFLSYLLAYFFSFDSFPSYLISSLLIGYSLFLISKEPKKEIFWPKYKRRGFLLFFLFLFLIWFIWFFNLKPLAINKEINLAWHLVKNNQCPKALSKMEEILTKRGILDSFLRLRYFEVLDRCQKPEEILEFTKKKIAILKEQVKIQPHYTRSWISLGRETNVLMELEPEKIERLKKEADYYFEKALKLSPKRQEIFIEWLISDFLAEKYQKAKEKAQKCLDLNEKLADCWWQKGISNIYLAEFEEAKENIKEAEKRGYPIDSEISLLELARAYGKVGNYQELFKVYQKLREKYQELSP